MPPRHRGEAPHKLWTGALCHHQRQEREVLEAARGVGGQAVVHKVPRHARRSSASPKAGERIGVEAGVLPRGEGGSVGEERHILLLLSQPANPIPREKGSPHPDQNCSGRK